MEHLEHEACSHMYGALDRRRCFARECTGILLGIKRADEKICSRTGRVFSLQDLPHQS
jgi:hypothetical protein